jgi:hypothetical protein
MVGADGGEWSDFLCWNHFSMRQLLVPIEYEDGLAPEPVW